MGPPGVYFGYRHPAWVAVPGQHFTSPIRRVAVPIRATAGVVSSAQPLSGPHAMARSGSFGPPVAGVQRAVGQPIARVPARQAVQPRPTPSAPSARTWGGPTGVSPRPSPRQYGGNAPARPQGGNRGPAPAAAPPAKGSSHPHAGSKSK
jgi:hypothetical protein